MVDVFEALQTRKSVRAFLPRELPEPALKKIFEAAQRAPSWCNIQPWRAWIASGETRAHLAAAMSRAASAQPTA